jgi:Sec-independent protein translocase protein TatA
MSLMINSDISKQFLLEEDAIKGFKKAVDNNQQRLAEETTVENVEPKIEEVKEEKKPAAKKAEAKEEKVQTEEK